MEDGKKELHKELVEELDKIKKKIENEIYDLKEYVSKINSYYSRIWIALLLWNDGLFKYKSCVLKAKDVVCPGEWLYWFDREEDYSRMFNNFMKVRGRFIKGLDLFVELEDMINREYRPVKSWYKCLEKSEDDKNDAKNNVA